MSIERTYWCEGPSCDIPRDEPVSHDDRKPSNVTTATPPPYLPMGVLEVREGASSEPETHHFCGWDCLMKYAAQQPVPEIIEGGF